MRQDIFLDLWLLCCVCTGSKKREGGIKTQGTSRETKLITSLDKRQKSLFKVAQT